MRKISRYQIGIPQGSILGPILFLLFINDLPQASKFNTTLFADDANLNFSHHDPAILQVKVNEEMKKIDKRMNLNRLTLNYNKCKYMILSKRKLALSQFQLTVNNSSIERTDCIRYLGVMIDDKLTCKSHIDKLHKKLSKICGLIFKLRHYVPLATCKLVYHYPISSEFGRKRLQYTCLKVWESIPTVEKEGSLSQFKKHFKLRVLSCYAVSVS